MFQPNNRALLFICLLLLKTIITFATNYKNPTPMAIDLQVEGLTKSFGALLLFENISFSVEERQRIGLIARNGKGKSTLLKIIAGGENYDSGAIIFRKDLKVGYLEQEPHFEPGTKVLDACLRRNREKAAAISRYEKAIAGGNEDAVDEELGDLLFAVVNLIRYRQRSRSEDLLRRANNKFEQRFRKMETFAENSGIQLADLSAGELDELWKKAKSAEK
jgi:ATPase subunit of ABC transporter with duplicated ATPase domains